MRVAVIGTGGIGGYYGGRLAAAGHDVAFVARGAHLQALRTGGLVVTGPAGDIAVEPVRVTSDTRDIGPVDVVLVCVKTWQLDAVRPALEPLLASGTAVMTLQNGVEAPDAVAAVAGRDAVLPGVAKVFANVAAPGRIRHVGGPGSLTFAEWDGTVTPRVRDLERALAEAGVPVVVADDIWAELWAKFLFVVPFGGLGAVADVPVGVLRGNPGTRRSLVDGMREIERVARALGVRLPDGIVDTTLAFVDQQPEAGMSSLHRDIAAGRPSELEAWNGAVVRLGERAGVDTPVHRVLYEVLRLRPGQSGAAPAGSGAGAGAAGQRRSGAA